MPRRASLLGRLLILLVLVSRAGIAQDSFESSSFLDAPIADVAEGASWRVRTEYLLWWSKGNPIPALVSTSPPGTPVGDAGVLGTPGAEVLFGNDQISNELRSGLRATLTRWLDAESTRAVEVMFNYVGNDYHTDDFTAQSLGDPILSRPFLNANTLAEDAELVAFPGQLAGRVDVLAESEVYSGEALWRQQLIAGDRGWIDVLVGYRYFRLRETLGVREDLTSTNPGGLIPLGTRFQVLDDFTTENDFHGGELGINAEVYRGVVSLELLGKVAFGNLARSTEIAGATTTTIPNLAPAEQPGGLLALPTNIGTWNDDTLGFLTEFGVQGKIQLTPRVNVSCGYSLILIQDVFRTGEQIDRVVNPSQIGGQPLVGPARPAPVLADSDFWLQGVNLGAEFAW